MFHDIIHWLACVLFNVPLNEEDEELSLGLRNPHE